MATREDLIIALKRASEAAKAGDEKAAQAARRFATEINEIDEAAARTERVNTAGQSIHERQAEVDDKRLLGGGGAFDVGMERLTDGMLFGLGDHLGALTSYLPQYGENPLEGLSYSERRDAYGHASELRADEAMPDMAQTGLEIAGTVLNPISALGTGYKGAAAAGAGVGAVEGGLNSDATTLPDLMYDTAIGSGVGVAGGVGGEALTGAAGRIVRGLFADEGTGAALDAARKLDIPVSGDLVGNQFAQRTAQALDTIPLLSPLSDALPGNSAGQIGREQYNALGDAVAAASRRGMTGELLAADNEVGDYLMDLAGRGRVRMKEEMTGMESAMDDVVDPATTVPLPNTQAVPGRLVDDSASPQIVGGAQAEVDNIAKGVQPRDVPSAQNRQYLDEATAELKQVDKQIAALTKNGNPTDQAAMDQLQALRRHKKDLEMGTSMLRQDAMNMEGTTMRGARQDRSMIGEGILESGVRKQEKDMIYGAMSQDLRNVIEASGDAPALQQFDDMLKRETEIFANNDILKRIAKPTGNTSNVGAYQRMLKGNNAEFGAMIDSLTPDEVKELGGNTIAMLARGKDGTFDPTKFANGWQSMSGNAKEALFDPEQIALFDAAEVVARKTKARAGEANKSGTANILTLIAGLGSMAYAPGRTSVALAGYTGLDKALTSEAMAKALAGETSELSRIIENIILGATVQTTGDSE